MTEVRLLLELFGEFARLGLISFGGTNLAEMERVLVTERHWISESTLAGGFALGQLMPGPNLLAVTHYGYAVAGQGRAGVGWAGLGWEGLAGALCATLGFYGPTALLSAAVALAWKKRSEHPWVKALRDALLPFGGGVMLAGSLVLARTSLHSAAAVAMAVVSFALLWKTRINSALVVVLAAVAGALLGL